jgi:hypothetical protein
MIELTKLTEHGIHAVPYRNGRPLAPVELPDGMIVENTTSAHQAHKPPDYPTWLGLDAEGRPRPDATKGRPGPCDGFLKLTGVFLLPSGDVGAVYGAAFTRSACRRAEPLSPALSAGRGIEAAPA